MSIFKSDNNIPNVSAEFGNQLARYLKHFGLTTADISKLIKSNTDAIVEVLEGEKGIVLKTAEKISWMVFGIRYYEFGNPKFPFPKKKSLPKATQEAIVARRKKGTSQFNRNTDLNLPIHINDVLDSGKLEHEFTSSDVWSLLPESIQGQIKSIRITDLFSKGELRDKIEYTGKKRGREKVYRLR